MANVLATQRGDVLEIALTRSDKQNALTSAMYQQINTLLAQAQADKRVKVVLLNGEGANFCAGNDIQDFAQALSKPEPLEHVVAFLHALVDFEKPLVAAIQGNAVGVGATLLLHCDYVSAADDVRIKFPFVQLGLVPEAGSTLLLPMLLGQRHSFDLMTSGQAIGAVRAQEIGLVNEILSQDDYLQHARQHAQQLAWLPSRALFSTKRLLKAPMHEQLHRVIDLEIEQFKQCLQSPYAQKAFAGFLNKAN